MSDVENIELSNRYQRQPTQQSFINDTNSTALSSAISVEPLEGGENPEDYPDGGLMAYSVILGSFLGLVVNLGIINSVGAIQTYVSNHQLSHLKQSSISWIFSIYLSLSYAGGLIVGPIFDKKGPLMILITSTGFIFMGLMAIANSVEIWQFILSFIALGIGNGFGMTPLIGVISHWFLKKRGNTTGIATSGGSVGGLIFPLMLRSLYPKVGFVWSIRILAFICLFCQVSSLLLVKERMISKHNQEQNNATSEEIAVEKKRFYVSWDMFKIKDYKFFFLALGGFCAELSLILLVTYYASYAIAHGTTESTSYLLLTLWNGTGIAGRWVPAYVSDYYGRFNVNIIMLLSYCLSIFVLLYPFASNQKILWAFAGIGGFCSGSILSLLPACLSQITPVKQIGTKYGILNFILSTANLFGIPIAAAIIDDGSSKQYNNFMVLVGCLSIGGVLFWAISRCIVLKSFKLLVKV
ncbi:unnamed protein product [Candida verbasci]|uniref:Major facilitator superfamily (MFS) profile domain-containing protein n=1 Tax=Candida verbasci TaxID=1227364 RepID=A0A9W4TRX2_9ASCO|nr:unnamed protein product [Candida verbasci]